MSRKRIYVAYFGGTIGMQADRRRATRRCTGTSARRSARRPELNARDVPELVVAEHEPLLDSANARPADWLRIARDIAQHRHSYDGFVVLHGTDTMAYTASALAFLLRGLGKPVVVTGSQIPLGVLRSDGRQNLLTSVLVAARDDVREVCLVFGSQILRGCARGQGERERLRGLRVARTLAAARQRGRADRDRPDAPAPARARRRRAADDARRARQPAAPVPGHARGAAARGAGRADPGARARGLRRGHLRRRRPVPAGGAGRGRAARHRDRRRQPVRRRPRRPRRLRHQRPADPRRRRRRARHDHRGGLRQARRAALRGPSARRRCAR